jgi:signal transduction histidine kinase
VKSWLRGKWGGLAAFLVIAGLVAGGLGWVTHAALRLEQEQLEFRAEANAWLALWRLDSRIFADLAREANWPLHEFRLAPVVGEPSPSADLVLVEMIPTGAVENLAWVQRRLLVVRKADWQTPQALMASWRQGLGLENKKERPPLADRPVLGGGFVRDPVLTEMLTQAAADMARPSSGPASETLNQVAQQPEAQGFFPNATPGQPAPQQAGKDAALRLGRAQMEMNQQKYQNQALLPDRTPKPAGPPLVLALRSPLVPAWLGDGEDRNLVVTRLLQVGERPACQVTLLDWPQLRRLLADEVRDLLPAPHLEPARPGTALNPDRTMTALPVILAPGPLTSGEAGLGLNPLRIGLALSWSAAFVALLAVGLGGWSLLNLSERRIRFVSAVTHELRTPLTTLRLYLDMLASGMVRDEQQKGEYIQTLNQEADRLNRLVGNVLDFSRLENQRPRLEMALVAVTDLLGQLQETWQGRCRNAAKELVIANELPADTVIRTDAQMVSQILANLIDNACKYSQGADDPRIWVRAKTSNGCQLLLEVEDRGRGVPYRERHLIFRPFRRGRSDQVLSGGVGLGLALAKQWARLLGGTLLLGSANGAVGACFRLELPLLPGANPSE